jgi:hypothetical protein
VPEWLALSRRLVVVGGQRLVELVGRTVVQNTFASGLGLNLSLDHGQSAISNLRSVMRSGMPTVGPGFGHVVRRQD